MYKLLMAVLVCFGLSACVPVLVVGGAATAGGSIIYNKRTFKTMMYDRSTSSTANARIAANTQLQGNVNITVATYNGIVLMVGEAKTEQDKDTAQQIVAALPHVRRIYNEVIIGPASDRKTRIASSVITSQVKAAMLTTPGVRSTQVKVVTNDRVVYLMGLVSHSEGNQMAEAARKVSGVTKVVKVFEYED
jgi:osmotically-inducible protein OsmY